MDNKTKALLSKAIVIVIELRQYAIEHPNSPGRHSGLCQSAADVLVELSALAGDQAGEITQLREQLAAVTEEREKVCYCRECKKSEQRGDIYICEEYGGRWTKDGYCSNGVPREWRGQQGAGEAAHD